MALNSTRSPKFRAKRGGIWVIIVVVYERYELNIENARCCGKIKCRKVNC